MLVWGRVGPCAPAGVQLVPFALSSPSTTATDFDACGAGCVWQSDCNAEYFDGCAPAKPFLFSAAADLGPLCSQGGGRLVLEHLNLKAYSAQERRSGFIAQALSHAPTRPTRRTAGPTW